MQRRSTCRLIPNASGSRASCGRRLNARELHLAHATHVPFENIEVLMAGRPAGSREPVEEAVEDRRGGYCFEQNTLFARAGEGRIRVTRLAARVRMGATSSITSRCHMLLRFRRTGVSGWRMWIRGDALLHPLPGPVRRPGSLRGSTG